MSDDKMIAALLREREGYVTKGKADRVAQVDEQLAVRGYVSRDEAPKGRRTSRGVTAARGES